MKWLLALFVIFLIGCGSTEQAIEPVIVEPAAQETVETSDTTESAQNIVPETSAVVPESAEAPEATAVAPSPAPPVEDIVVFNITGNNFLWNPPTIRVTQGDKVRLYLTSADVFHGFAIEEYDLNVPVMPGETETVDFVADKKGNFTFFCSVYCGSGHGRMKGTLIVE